MVYLGFDAEYLPQTGASGNYLPGVLKNDSTQKMITYSDSTRRIVQQNVFCFLCYHFEFGQKMAQSFPKSYTFLFNMQTGKCLPYAKIQREGAVLFFPLNIGDFETSYWSS